MLQLYVRNVNFKVTAGVFRNVVNLKSVEIEDICFFEVNTKYISSNVLRTSEFSRVCSTSENSDVFNSRDIFGIYPQKQ